MERFRFVFGLPFGEDEVVRADDSCKKISGLGCVGLKWVFFTKRFVFLGKSQLQVSHDTLASFMILLGWLGGETTRVEQCFSIKIQKQQPNKANKARHLETFF